MLNKRHCSPAKGLKSRRHCALSPVLIRSRRRRRRRRRRRLRLRRKGREPVGVSLVAVALSESTERGGRSGGREYLPTNTDWCREPFVLNKYTDPPTPRAQSVRHPYPTTLSLALVVRATCLSDWENVYRLE